MKTSRVVAAATLLTLGMAAMPQTYSNQPVRVVVNGEELTFPAQQPIRRNGRVLVPLRGIFERLGASVNWNPDTEVITARKAGVRVQLAIGQNDASVNGRDVTLDVPASLVNGSTMVPLRFVSEALGADVTWNEVLAEVDITQQSDALLGTQVNPETTTVVRSRPVDGPDRPVPIMEHVIKADTVIPWSLDTPLSSRDSRPGEAFTATLAAEGPDYLGIPAGSQLKGSVSSAKPKAGSDPGVLELKFDQIITPDGRRILVDGRLIGLDDKSVTRERGGALVAKDSTRNDRVAFAGYGAGAGLIVGLLTNRPIEDTVLGGLLGFAVGSAQKQRQVNDVSLDRGTQFGMRLHRELTLQDPAD